MTETLRNTRLKKTLLNSTSKKEARIKAGYSESYATSGQLDKTEGGKQANASALAWYQKELERIQFAMEEKDLTKEQYATLVSAMDRMQKQIQLLSGGATESFNLLDTIR